MVNYINNKKTLTLVWQCSNISCISLTLSSLWYCTFSSISTKACFRFSTSFWCNSVKSFICSSNRSVRNRSSWMYNNKLKNKAKWHLQYHIPPKRHLRSVYLFARSSYFLLFLSKRLFLLVSLLIACILSWEQRLYVEFLPEIYHTYVNTEILLNTTKNVDN